MVPTLTVMLGCANASSIMLTPAALGGQVAVAVGVIVGELVTVLVAVSITETVLEEEFARVRKLGVRACWCWCWCL